jgi:hypothetical protein
VVIALSVVEGFDFSVLSEVEIRVSIKLVELKYLAKDFSDLTTTPSARAVW